MWIWRRMERVKWTDRIRNEAVLERVDEERMMLKLIKKRKRNWLGHWLRRNCLLKDALEGMANVYGEVVVGCDLKTFDFAAVTVLTWCRVTTTRSLTRKFFFLDGLRALDDELQDTMANWLNGLTADMCHEGTLKFYRLVMPFNI
ncbi:hypothetical protein ANN_09881 [Periplaneta americana]|uniref:Uncharacterized protein n=1 Tax=Periplaneta americana TaxID=6978 RepID=A0ABQ8TQ69_PERAM|nr:hypothetical protein ANN_09881 [Periplaneta americana]